MEWMDEQVRWIVKVLQPENNVGSLPAGREITEATRAALLGLDVSVFRGEFQRLTAGAASAAGEIVADASLACALDALPLRKGAKVVAFGDSHTSDPQSWAVILAAALRQRRPQDDISITACAVSGDTTTQGLIRFLEVVQQEPDWIVFFIGANDARTHGKEPRKLLVSIEETERNLAELRAYAASQTNARRLWVVPPAVIEDRVANHWALSGNQVRFLNQNLIRVAEAIRALGDPIVELQGSLGLPPPASLLMEDGLHFTRDGQKRIATEVLRAWAGSALR